MSDIPWSSLYKSRKNIRKQFPSVWKIPVRKKVANIIKDLIKNEQSILDVGSCNRNFKKVLDSQISNYTYKSMDIDRENFHDYYNMDDIDEKFDIVTMFECIEHLTLEEGFKTISQIYRVLRPGGLICVSTPNTFHPNRYWECTHKVPFRYDELGGFIEMSGFNVNQIFRIYNDSFFNRIFRLYVTCHIHRYFDIDFAKSILVVGRKPAQD